MVVRAKGKIPKAVLLDAADLVKSQCLRRKVGTHKSISEWRYDRERTKCYQGWDKVTGSRQFDVLKYMYSWLYKDPKPENQRYVSTAYLAFSLCRMDQPLTR
jgi:hypothetical protein